MKKRKSDENILQLSFDERLAFFKDDHPILYCILLLAFTLVLAILLSGFFIILSGK
ncbi:MAG: hypothetical protein LIO44_00240 [Eubacterium sp.]|nr:hypothetical protein [Eubacterium sp.]